MPRAFPQQRSRKAAIVVWAALLMVLIIAMVAFGIDVGYMLLVRTELARTADSSAMAGAAVMGDGHAAVLVEANKYANLHGAAGSKVNLAPEEVELGTWDAVSRTFTPSANPGNAVRVMPHRENVSLFFGSLLGRSLFDSQAQAVAMANPRDICFVVDLSGSMNDDTEPCWATTSINSKFGPEGYPTVGDQLMKDLYQDFGFGAFPGVLEYIGKPLGVKADKNAYAEMTKDGGPLTGAALAAKYRILSTDNEAKRKVKAYSWLIDNQLRKAMPNAKPTLDSSTNYAYWERYLDYLILQVTISTVLDLAFTDVQRC